MIESSQSCDKKVATVPPVPSSNQPSETIKEEYVPQNKYPRYIGQRFDPEGQPLHFPGKTVICHLQPESPVYSALLGMYNELKVQEFSSLYTLLPPASWHMTIFEGIGDQTRKPGFWPVDLPLDTSLGQCTTHFPTKVEELPYRQPLAIQDGHHGICTIRRQHCFESCSCSYSRRKKDSPTSRSIL
jgi:hypothetical protein